MDAASPIPPVPPIGDWRADGRWRAIELVSDVHLTPSMPRTFAAWRERMLHGDVDAIVLLGDVFDAWAGDDMAEPGAAAALGDEAAAMCAEAFAVLREAAARRPGGVAWIAGNRDFLVGEARLRESGVVPLPDPVRLHAFGRAWLLSHGDALCLDDTDYQQARRTLRSPAWQADFLARSLAERAALARSMRARSVAHQAGRGVDGWADVDAPAARAWLDAAGCDTLVHGHTHRPGAHDLGGGRRRIVLGDWDWDGPAPRATVARLDAGGERLIDLAASFDA